MRKGSYSTIVALRSSDISRQLASGEFFLNPIVFQRFALILVGLGLARIGILTRPALDSRLLRTTLWAGLGVGLLGAGLLLLPGLGGPRDYSVRFYSGLVARQLLLMLASPPLAFAYAAGLLLLAQRSAAWRARLAPLNLIGRAALSNFLLQYAFIFLLFWLQRWGMIGDTSAGIAVLLAVAVFAAEILLSRWWLARFRFGPAEWAWRVVTYWSLPRMRLEHSLRGAEA